MDHMRAWLILDAILILIILTLLFNNVRRKRK